MLEYNYIYGFLNNYGNYINGMAPGTEEWRDTTTNFATELFKVLKNEEKYLLGQIKPSAANELVIEYENTGFK